MTVAAELIALATALGAPAMPDAAPIALPATTEYVGEIYAGTNWWVQRTTTVWGDSGVGPEQYDLRRGTGVYVSAGPIYADGLWWFYADSWGYIRADDLGYAVYIPPVAPPKPQGSIPVLVSPPSGSSSVSMASGAPVAATPAPPVREGGIHYTYYYCQYNGGVRGDGGGWCRNFANGEAVSPAHSGRVAACGSNWKLGDYAAGYRCVDRGHLAPNQVDVFYYYSSEARLP